MRPALDSVSPPELPPLGAAAVDMRPGEIRTLLFPPGGGRPVREASLLED